VLNGLGMPEILVLLVLALFLFGPERLPGVARDAAKVLRQLRNMANDVTQDLRSELGPEMKDLQLEDLHPRRFVERHLLSDLADDEAPVGSRPGVPAQGTAAPRRTTPRPVDPTAAPSFDPDTT
jgi:sec-independent protein translocase protein TatB